MDNDTTIESKVREYTDDAIKVLDYLARYRLVYIYKTADGIKTAIKSFWGWECQHHQDNAQMTRYMTLMPNVMSILCPQVRLDGRLTNITRAVEKAIRSKYRVVGKRDTKYASGKEWHRKSYILIQPTHIDEIMDIKIGGRLEDRYTSRQCRLIRKIVYGNKAPDNTSAALTTSSSSSSSSSSSRDEYVARLERAVRHLHAQCRAKDEEIARLKADMQASKPPATKPDANGTSSAASPVNAPEDEHIEMPTHAEQMRAKAERIAKVYSILYMYAMRHGIIPSSIVNDFSHHYHLGKKMPYNGWTWDSDDQRRRYEAIYSNIIYRIDNNLQKDLCVHHDYWLGRKQLTSKNGN